MNRFDNVVVVGESMVALLAQLRKEYEDCLAISEVEPAKVKGCCHGYERAILLVSQVLSEESKRKLYVMSFAHENGLDTYFLQIPKSINVPTGQWFEELDDRIERICDNLGLSYAGDPGESITMDEFSGISLLSDSFR